MKLVDIALEIESFNLHYGAIYVDVDEVCTP
jgi:hypothetical protein